MLRISSGCQQPGPVSTPAATPPGPQTPGFAGRCGAGRGRRRGPESRAWIIPATERAPGLESFGCCASVAAACVNADSVTAASRSKLHLSHLRASRAVSESPSAASCSDVPTRPLQQQRRCRRPRSWPSPPHPPHAPARSAATIKQTSSPAADSGTARAHGPAVRSGDIDPPPSHNPPGRQVPARCGAWWPRAATGAPRLTS